MFFLLSILLYLRFEVEARRRWYILSLCAFVADHWQYTSIVGIIALLVGLGTWSWKRRQKNLRGAGLIVATVAVALLCNQSWNRCGVFRNAETLWNDTLAKNPSAWMAHHNLAIVLVRQERIEEAIPHYRQTLRIRPDSADADNNLGIALAKQGKVEEAIRHYRQALRIKPDHPSARFNLRLAVQAKGRASEKLRTGPPGPTFLSP